MFDDVSKVVAVIFSINLPTLSLGMNLGATISEILNSFIFSIESAIVAPLLILIVFDKFFGSLVFHQSWV